MRHLADQDFVRRLAHSLVFDQDRVDDAVQDAWVAALRRPPQHAAAAPTWFGRVLQNLAHRRARDDARRQQRERAAAIPEALPSVDDVVAREQQRRRVVDAVLALPEPYRATVLARFFDDQSPSAIARARGVPAATVRSQLLRGLELLRTRLDGDYGGDRRAWCLALLPLARPSATGMGSLVSIGGALLMWKGMIAGSVLALGLLGYLWWTAAAAPALPSLTVQANAAPPPIAAPRTTDTADEPPAPREALAAAAPAPATDAFATAGLRGRVLDADGAPAGGRLVRVHGIDGVSLFADAADRGEHPGPSLPHGEARTAADGTFTIAGIWPHVRYAVHADADGDARTMRSVEAMPAPGEVIDVGDLHLVPKGAIAGRAVDGDDVPIADAEVLAFDLPAALTALLPLDGLQPEHGAMLTIPAPAATATDLEAARAGLRGYFARHLFVDRDIDQRDGMQTLVLERMAWADDLFAALPIATARTAADGRFALRGVQPGQNLLVLRRAGLQNATRPAVTVRAGATNDVGDVTLAEGEELRGSVADAAGQPLRDAEVRIAPIGAYGYRGIAFCRAPLRTGADGAFRCKGLPRGRALVAVRARAGAPWHTLGPVATDDDLEVRLPAGSALDVLVRGGDGNRRNAAVQVFAGPPLHELRRMGLQRPLALGDQLQWRTDDAFTIAGLPPGCLTLRVEAPGCVAVETIVVLPHSETLELVLPTAAPLQVRARDADGAAVAGAKVYLHRQQPSAAEQNVLPSDYGLPRWSVLPRCVGVTDANGELQVADRPDAAVAVFVVPPRLPPATVLVAAGEPHAEVVLPRAGALHGRVFDGGVPAAPERWSVVATREDLGAMPSPPLRRPLAADGTFAFPGLAPGPYRVHVEPRHDEPARLRALVEHLRDVVFSPWPATPRQIDVEVAPGATAELAFELDPNRPAPDVVPAQLSGRVRCDDQPIVGAHLQRRVSLLEWATLATTGADGAFAANAVVPGNHDLRLLQDGAELWAGSAHLPAGAATVLELTWRTGSLRGRAVRADGQPIGDLTVEAVGQCAGGTVRRTAEVAADGTFALPSLPAGAFQVQAQGATASSQPVAVTIAGGAAAAPIRLDLVAHAVLRGRIALDDVPHTSATLLIRSDHVFQGVSVDGHGGFSFTPGTPAVYRLELVLDGRYHLLEPCEFDLRAGDRTDVVLRVLGPAPIDDR